MKVNLLWGLAFSGGGDEPIVGLGVNLSWG